MDKTDSEKEIKKENSHDISIALIQKDIQYINQTLQGIGTQILAMDRNYARKDELKEIERVLTKMLSDTTESVKLKVDKTDFDPIKKTLYRINWMLIAAVIVGLLALIINTN